MKKRVFIAVLGLGASLVSSHGQGFVVFSSYTANGGVGALTSFAFFSTGPVGIGYTAYLYYALGTVSDPVNNSSFVSIMSPVSSAFTLLPGASAAYDNSGAAFGAAGLGYFDSGVFVIPGYTGGPITFEIFATDAQGVRFGRSGSFIMDSIDTNPAMPASEFGDNGQPMPTFTSWACRNLPL